MLHLFQLWFSKPLIEWHIDFSWNKVVCVDSTGPPKWYTTRKSLGTTMLADSCLQFLTI